MGIPVLHGVAGESAEIVTRLGAGITFEPENSDELLENLVRLKTDRSLYNRLRSNGLAGAKQFDRVELAGRMLDILSSFVEPRSKK